MLTPERKKDQERWSLLMNFLKKKDKTTLKRLNTNYFCQPLREQSLLSIVPRSIHINDNNKIV